MKNVNLIFEIRNEYNKLFRKSDQRKNLHNPYYLLHRNYVTNTHLMRVLAKDIMFCRYQYQLLDSDNYLVYDGTDYEKLRQLLCYDYGIDINVGRYFSCYRLFRLMQYIEKNISEEHRKALYARDLKEKELGKKLFQLLCNCCDGGTPRFESNPAFLNIDFIKFEERLYQQYHILFSPYERRQLNTVKAIINHVIFRLRDGGRIYNEKCHSY